MFATIAFDECKINQIRMNKTGICKKRKHFHLNSFENRPFTTPIPFHNHQQPFYKTIELAQHQLNIAMKGQQNDYLRHKIKTFTNRHHHSIINDRSVDQNIYDINPEKILNNTINEKKILQYKINSPRNISQMKICSALNASQLKCKEVINQAQLLNTKQKIYRLLELKVEQQKKFQQLKSHLKSRQKLVERQWRHKSKQTRTKKKFYHEKWDTQWKNNYKNELQRYKNRLSLKHNQRSMTIPIKI